MNNSEIIKEIIELVKEQYPTETGIIEGLKNAPEGKWTSNAYYQFVDSSNANAPGADWQFDENIVLEKKGKGDIVLDLLKDGRVGGIEFLDHIRLH